MSSVSRPRAGRPRALATATTLSPRDQILDAAAELFVSNGVSATTTRAIAERVGIRQASLYYHFAGKDDLLLELLERTVRPALELVAELDASAAVHPAAALYSLASHDAAALANAPHNIGSLYLLPELAQERFDSFHRNRTVLREAYGRWGMAAAADDVRAEWDEDLLGSALIHLVELVIPARRDGVAVDHAQIASACLRLCGLTSAQIAAAQS